MITPDYLKKLKKFSDFLEKAPDFADLTKKFENFLPDQNFSPFLAWFYPTDAIGDLNIGGQGRGLLLALAPHKGPETDCLGTDPEMLGCFGYCHPFPLRGVWSAIDRQGKSRPIICVIHPVLSYCSTYSRR